MGFLDRLRGFADSVLDQTGGVRASATIERIVITDRWRSREGLGAGDGAGYDPPDRGLTFRVDGRGRPGG